MVDVCSDCYLDTLTTGYKPCGFASIMFLMSPPLPHVTMTIGRRSQKVDLKDVARTSPVDNQIFQIQANLEFAREYPI